MLRVSLRVSNLFFDEETGIARLDLISKEIQSEQAKVLQELLPDFQEAVEKLLAKQALLDSLID